MYLCILQLRAKFHPVIYGCAAMHVTLSRVQGLRIFYSLLFSDDKHFDNDRRQDNKQYSTYAECISHFCRCRMQDLCLRANNSSKPPCVSASTCLPKMRICSCIITCSCSYLGYNDSLSAADSEPVDKIIEGQRTSTFRHAISEAVYLVLQIKAQLLDLVFTGVRVTHD